MILNAPQQSHHILKDFLDQQVDRFNNLQFIKDDPISIPHRYVKKQDIEIAGFWTAMLSWGQRKTIIDKAGQLMSFMDNAPYDFILNHTEKDRKPFLQFKHRTFQPDDALYFLEFFQTFYRKHKSLEKAFFPHKNHDVKSALVHFHEYFFSLDVLMSRTKKHVSTPTKNSSCKRLNMFLRWMIRRDSKGVDFGIWNSISPRDLKIPLDVHVLRVSRRLNLLERRIPDWKAVEELTMKLRQMDINDPVKYDYALFGLGIKNRLPSRRN